MACELALAEPRPPGKAKACALPLDATGAQDLLQWTWGDSWAVPGAQLLQWSSARPAEALAVELEAHGNVERPVQVYSTWWSLTHSFASPAVAAKCLREGCLVIAPDELNLDFAKPPAITGMGDILSLGALSLTVTTATTVGLALSPVFLVKHMTQVMVSNLSAPCMSRNCCAQRPADTPDKLSADDFRDTDRHWDPMLRVRRREAGNQSLKFPEGVVRKAMYVRMSDGVDIAVDILLPPPPMGQHPCPCIVQFARYWRAYEIRWPLRALINDGEPWDFMHGETKSELLLAGFAWVSADVRGCGASGGRQNVVWSDREILDVMELIDFIVGDTRDGAQRPRQPWSDGRVGLYGVSYDGGVALRAAARGHPAVKAMATTFPFGDVWRELFPGGIMNNWFLKTWSEFNSILDNASLASVHPAAPVAVKGAAPAGPRELHDAAVVAHTGNWNLMDAAALLLGVDSPVTLPEGQTITPEILNLWLKHGMELRSVARDPFGNASPEAVFPSLAALDLPVLLVSGWLCVTTRAVCQAFAAHAQPGWRLLLGPWNHGGAQHYRYARGTRPMHFAMAADTASFFLKHMPLGCPAGPSSPPSLARPPRTLRQADGSPGSGDEAGRAQAHFYISGASPGWVHCYSWPPPGVSKRPLWLTAEGTLTPAPPEEADEAFVGTRQLPCPTGIPGHLWAGNSRYVTMIKAMDPIGYTWQAPPSHTYLMYESGPLEEPVTVVGSPIVSLHLRSTAYTPGASASDADVFAYLCARWEGSGPPVYITEGQLRLSHRAEAEQPSEVAAADCAVADDEISQQAAAADYRHGKEPFHTFRTGDRAQLPSADWSFRARISLLPVGYRFDRGACIVLILASDDAAHFAPNPTLAAASDSELPVIAHGASEPSLLWLPILPEADLRRRSSGSGRFPCAVSPTSHSPVANQGQA